MALTDQKRSQCKHAPSSFLTLLGSVDAVSENCRILTTYVHPTETLNSNAYGTEACIQCVRVFITNRFAAYVSQTPYPRKTAALKPF
jgi:hypothetical protein